MYSTLHEKNTMKIKFVIILILIIGALAAGTFIFWKAQKDDSTQPVIRGDLAESIYGLGTVKANQSYQLKVGITTTILKVFTNEGDVVKAGAPLIKLDEGRSAFKAPFAGTITSLPFKVEETVYPQTPILTLTNLEDRYILISLEQEGALRVRNGQNAKVSFESIRGKVFTGKVTSLYPSENQFLVKIDVPHLPLEILPGMTGDVAIEVAVGRDVTLVPIRAVHSGRVLVREGNKNRKITISLGASDGHFGEVLSDNLKVGDEVVVPKD